MLSCVWQARAVNELYREHLFRLGITFHGGTYQIIRT